MSSEKSDYRLVDRRCVLLVHQMRGLGDVDALDDRQQLFQAVGPEVRLVLLMAGLTVASATTALLLPVRGVHLQIRAAKLEELERVNRAIRGDAEALRGSALAKREATPSLADLVAYRNLVDSAREWPFDASTFRRFGLYLMIPLGSWMGGALVERLMEAVLE